MVEYFANRTKQFEELRKKVIKKEKKLSLARIYLSAFTFFLLVFFLSAGSMILIYLTVVLYTVFFVILISKHRYVKSKRLEYDNYVSINLKEKNRLSHNFEGIDGGARFADPDHDYSNDLDLFGKSSLFQLLTRNETELGKEKLAYWISNQEEFSNASIKARQIAIQELIPKIEWRQKLQVNAIRTDVSTSSIENLIRWMKSSIYDFPKTALITYAIFSPLCLISFIAFHFVFDSYLALTGVTFVLICNIVYLEKLRGLLDSIVLAFRQNLPILESYANIINNIVDSKFSSDLLIYHQEQLKQSNAQTAVKDLVRVGMMLELIGQRGLSYEPIYKNFFYVIVNHILLFDTYLLIIANAWKKRSASKVVNWFEAVSEIETIASLSGFAFANSEFTFPHISADCCQIQAVNISHPLIADEKRVYNNFSFVKRVTLTTGFNMAGKSTFLRTIGISAILAYIGAPVCAKYLSIPRLKLFTSMRTVDNLNENASTFGAELKRIKSLLEIAKSECSYPLFFIVDEVFKGTNAYDRQVGTYSIIQNLIELKAFGMIAMHDTEIAKHFEYASNVDNYYFSSMIVDNKFFFDYILKRGICHETNASQLMENIGLRILLPHKSEL